MPYWELITMRVYAETIVDAITIANRQYVADGLLTPLIVSAVRVIPPVRTRPEV
jgi:hypothetical protein